MPEPEAVRIELKGALSGHHILVNPEELTFGFLEDLQGEKAKAVLDALALCIVGGDLPAGSDRTGLRRLKPDGIASVIEGVGAAFAVPKS